MYLIDGYPIRSGSSEGPWNPLRTLARAGIEANGIGLFSFQGLKGTDGIAPREQKRGRVAAGAGCPVEAIIGLPSGPNNQRAGSCCRRTGRQTCSRANRRRGAASRSPGSPRPAAASVFSVRRVVLRELPALFADADDVVGGFGIWPVLLP